MPETPRLRFAPSPTGTLHVGSVRTALFSWLFARHHSGAFVLRIEDTDVARSRTEWTEGIQSSMRWLGLDWDEGPILQSTRFALYDEAIAKLLADGLAYESFETPEELAAMNDERRARKLPPGYAGRARDIPPEAPAALGAAGRPAVVRLRTPDDGRSTFHDEIRGDVSVEWSSIADFVIRRADGTPTFFLANALDDIDMGITHAIRGEDLIDSTHRILAVRRALGAERQLIYAHIPLILSADRAKLSKRHGAVSVEEFRDQGYLPEALINYLGLLGWAPADGREVMTLAEMAAEFDLDHVTHSAAIFDHQKLDWLNGEYLRALTPEHLEERALPVAVAAFGPDLDRDVLSSALVVAQARATTLNRMIEQMDFLFESEAEFEIAPESWEKLAGTERVDEILAGALQHLITCEWTVEGVDLRPVLNRLEIKPKKAMPALYAAIEGRHAGLPLFDSMHLLGRERACARLIAARDRLASG
ncbi:MAG: glutamyl-tRNA synthetase [Actinomycetia bacterium]|nr:glutamyl-tRNA synthetase [Actinomycetes bacterium]